MIFIEVMIWTLLFLAVVWATIVFMKQHFRVYLVLLYNMAYLVGIFLLFSRR